MSLSLGGLPLPSLFVFFPLPTFYALRLWLLWVKWDGPPSPSIASALVSIDSDAYVNGPLARQDPVAAGGINLDLDTITTLVTDWKCPNLCGVKLTYVSFYDLWFS